MRSVIFSLCLLLSVPFTYAQQVQYSQEWGQCYGVDTWISEITSAALSHDNRLAATSDLNYIRLYDIDKKMFVRSFRDWPPRFDLDVPAGLAFSSDNKKLICGFWDKIAVWDLEEEYPEHVFETRPGSSCEMMTATKNGQYIVTTSYLSHTITLYEYPSGTFVNELKLPNDAVIDAVLYDNDSKIAVGTIDGNVILVEIPSMTVFRQWTAYASDVVKSVALNQDETAILTGSRGLNQIKMWDAETGVFLQDVFLEGGVVMRRVWDNNIAFYGSETKLLYVMNLDSMFVLGAWQQQGRHIESIYTNGDDVFLADMYYDQLHVKHASDPYDFYLVTRPDYVQYSSIISSNNNTLVNFVSPNTYGLGILPKGYIVHDYQTGKRIGIRIFNDNSIHSASVSNDGDYLAISLDNSIDIIDLKRDSVLYSFPYRGDGKGVASITSSNNSFVIVDEMEDIRVFDIATGSIVQRYYRTNWVGVTPVNASYYEQGNMLVLEYESGVEVVRLQNPVIARTFSGNRPTLIEDATKLMTLFNGVVELYDIQSGSMLTEYDDGGHSTYFVADGSLVSVDIRDRAWHVYPQMQQNFVLANPVLGSVRSITASPDQTSFALISVDNSLVKFKVEIEATNAVEPSGSHLEDWGLSPAYPNPFTASTNISYSLPTQEFITLEVYNVLGQKVRTLFSGRREPGTHTARFDATGLSAGMYRIVLRSGAGIKTQIAVVR